MNTISFYIQDVPAHWPLCFNAACKKSAECLRYLAGTKLPVTAKVNLAVTPQAKGYGEQCEMYQSLEPVHLAYGFRHFYDVVLKKDFTNIRKELTRYFHGVRQYYWYLNEERGLTPKQQNDIKKIFAQHGYTDLPEFGRYEDRIVFE